MNKFNWRMASGVELCNEVFEEYLSGNMSRMGTQYAYYKRMAKDNPENDAYACMVDKLSRAYKHLAYMKMKALVQAYEEGQLND